MIDVIIITLLAFVTFITRVVNLLTIPMFTDEAIYIRWAQIGLADPAQRFISLTDGKQPLLTWLMYPFLAVFQDPLFAGRFVSVLSGVLGCIGMYVVGRALFGRGTAILSSLLYIISPFAMVYDRLALMDSLLSALGLWSLYLQILLVRKIRLDVALLLGMTMGLALLTKSSAFFFIYLIPVSLMLFDFSRKNRFKRFVKWIFFVSISTAMAIIMYHSLRLSPWFYIIEQKNYTFIYTTSEMISKSFEQVIPNLNGLMSFFVPYMTPPLIGVLLTGLVIFFLRRDRSVLFLFLWFLLPFIVQTLYGKVLYPRYLLFMVMPLFVIISETLRIFIHFSRTKMRPFLALVPIILLYPFYQSALIMISPIHAAIPRNDRNQLFDDWPSGYGVREVVEFVREKATKGRVTIGTEGTFGLFPAAIQIYLQENKNVDIHGYWPVGEVPAELTLAAKDHPTYLVFKERQKIPDTWPLELIAKYRRGLGNTYLLFYQVVPGKIQTE